ncbi:D-alanine--D-alanine ligase [Flavobacterium sp. 9AF]|uniref:D-alanine--D-alanine ligase n=1 Tax=Flavobacterium sp. 9AF TaxID=2653142 RepID=UPI0012F02580|nr:D-alanine--D-alanine ligase [Flavobacterium sp. 9AF]VXC16031.1 D-alanine--D-alanine ligase [Flavobacterium sp. 9AF]
MNRIKLSLHKLTHWEYWPYQVVYLPIYFQYLYYVIRTRSFFYFNASNPTIRNGGFLMESKKEIYDLIPQKYYPKTVLIQQAQLFETILEACISAQISFPFIAKPDVGLRGTAVKRIANASELLAYHTKADFNYLIQNLIPYPKEIGLFYVRYPNQNKGTITGIVEKEFLIVSGNGVDTIEELLLQNPRYAFQIPVLKKELQEKLQEVLLPGEKRNLVPYGNHCRGSKFIDASHHITPQLIKTFDEVCLEIDGFYFGRMDIMFESYELLEKGEAFQIVEINGALSEPTHIYDPKHSLLFGWKELTRHFHYMYEISKINHEENNSPYLTFKEGLREFKKHHQYYDVILKF